MREEVARLAIPARLLQEGGHAASNEYLGRRFPYFLRAPAHTGATQGEALSAAAFAAEAGAE